MTRDNQLQNLLREFFARLKRNWAYTLSLLKRGWYYVWNHSFSQYCLGVVSAFNSMLILTTALLFYILTIIEIPIGEIERRAERLTEKGLEYLFPEYYTYIGDLRVDYDVGRPGWIAIEEIVLINSFNASRMHIKDVGISPNIFSFFTGNPRFERIWVSNVSLINQLEPVDDIVTPIYPINFADVPASLLTNFGRLSIEDVDIVVIDTNGKERFDFTNLQTRLQRVGRNYQLHLTAENANSEHNAISLMVERQGRSLTLRANTLNYPINDRLLSLNAELGFQKVPRYDASDPDGNMRHPDQYLRSALGFLRIASDDIEVDATLGYNNFEKTLEFNNFYARNKEQTLRGNVGIGLGDGIRLFGDHIDYEYPTANGHSTIHNMSLDTLFDWEKKQVLINSIQVAEDNIALNAVGEFVWQNDATLGDLTVDVKHLDRAVLIEAWPKEFGNSFIDWFKANTYDAALNDFTLNAHYDQTLTYEGAGSLDNLDLRPSAWLPRLQATQADIILHTNYLEISSDEVRSQQLGDEFKGEDVSVIIEDLSAAPIVMSVSAKMTGDLQNTILALNQEPLNMPRLLTKPADDLTGVFAGELALELPLKKGTKLSNMDLDFKAQIDDVIFDNILQEKAVEADTVNMEINEEGMLINGEAAWDELKADVKIEKVFKKGTPLLINIHGEAEKSDLARFMETPPEIIPEGIFPLDLTLALQKDTPVKMDARVDITGHDLSFDGIGQIHDKGDEGFVSLNAEIDQGKFLLKSMDAQLSKLDAEGDLNFDSNGKFAGANVSSLRFMDLYEGSVIVDLPGSIILKDAHIHLSKLFDFVDMFDGASDSRRDFDVIADNIALEIMDNMVVTDIHGELFIKDKISSVFQGRMNGKTSMKGTLHQRGDKFHVNMTTQNAGQLLNDAGLYRHLRDGAMVLNIQTTDRKGVLTGHYAIKDIKLLDSQSFVKLLKAGSILGVLDSSGVRFSYVAGDFLASKDQLNLYQGRAVGPSLGLTYSGLYHFNEKYVNVTGVMSPAYLVNGFVQKLPIIGDLLAGHEGEGVYGMNYSIYGNTDDVNVRANPLSLLTTGVIRRIWGQKTSILIPDDYKIQ